MRGENSENWNVESATSAKFCVEALPQIMVSFVWLFQQQGFIFLREAITIHFVMRISDTPAHWIWYDNDVTLLVLYLEH